MRYLLIIQKINGNIINLHKHTTLNTFDTTKINDNNRVIYLYNQLKKIPKKFNQENIIKLSNKLYQKGYSGLDLMSVIEKIRYRFIKKV